MKIFIFGSNGMLGRYLTYYLKNEHTVVPMNRGDFDITGICNEVELNQLNKSLTDNEFNKGDVIINAAGMIKPMINSADDILDAIKVNAMFPHKLQQICDNFEATLIHITTDCVYSGKKGEYNELDLPDSIDAYGMTKYLGEPSEACVIRTSIIGEEVHNQRSLMEWVKNNADGEINGFINHEWNGVTCLELAKIINKIIKDNLFWEGIKHIHSDSVTKYTLLNFINNIYNLHIKVDPVEAEVAVNRTLSSVRPFVGVTPESDLYTQIQEMKNFSEILTNE